MNKVAEFNNAELGIRAVVMQNDGEFDVAAFDTDANMMIEARHGFKSEVAAVAYAAKFIDESVLGASFTV
jgi:hypothetical protein